MGATRMDARRGAMRTLATPAHRTDALPPALSVVVVSYGREDDIVHTLEDLALQEHHFPMEVVLVLQAYPAGVPERLVRDFGERMPLRVHVYERGLGVHGARNAALTHVSGAIVAFLDDDVRLPPTWAATLLPFYDDARVGGVGGYVRHPGCRRLSARLLRPMLGMASRRYRIDWGGFNTLPFSSHPAEDQPADWLSGCNMSFRREALRDAGEFDESYGSYGYDDVDMGLRVRQAGWALLSSPRLAIDHFPSAKHRPDFRALMEEEEARRVILVRKAIGDRPLWRARYLARLALHVVATFVQGVSRGTPGLALSAIAGARRGLAQHG